MKDFAESVLVVSPEPKYRAKSLIWHALEQHIHFEHEVVADEEALVDFVSGLDKGEYSRVVVNSNMRRIGRPLLKLADIPGLVIYDFDVYQHNVPYSEWYGRYVAALKSLGQARIIVSGYSLSRQLASHGIDVKFLPKAYDPNTVQFLNTERSHDIAFVGRTKNKVYKERRKFLEKARHQLGVPTLRAEPGAPYNKLLNSIRFFLSVDIGYGEYMIKNFEAMAAGCVLLAWRQSEDEQKALGFVDMENVVLYSSLEELQDKYNMLRKDPEYANAIAEKGRKLAEDEHTWYKRAELLPELLAPPIGTPERPSIREKLRLLRM